MKKANCFPSMLLTVLLVFSAVSSSAFASETETEKNSLSSQEAYTLDRVVILSRHNIRSPLSGSGSLLGDITPHTWFRWTSRPSELSLRGAILETQMGQYFRQWLEKEGLFSENYPILRMAKSVSMPTRNSARWPQRTISRPDFFPQIMCRLKVMQNMTLWIRSFCLH